MKVDKNKPIPAKRGSEIAATMRKLEIGDSFFISGFHNNGKFHSTAKRIGIKITMRSEKNGYRIWRTA